jgi:hypothetical protein
MLTFTSKRILTDAEKESVLNELEFHSVVSSIISFLKYIQKHPENLEIKHIKNENGRSYRKVIEVPLPKLKVNFIVDPKIDIDDSLEKNKK